MKGRFRLGGSIAKGCTDETLPIENKMISIPYELFFARNSKSWDDGGVAFISTKKDETAYTYARMWKITEEQFSEIWDQEGPGWYDKKLDLGQDENDIPIVTITSSNELPYTKPSDNYLKTIIMGLQETIHLDKKEIIKYLINKQGVKGKMSEKEIEKLFNSS